MMTRDRVVFATNVLISGALSATSTPARALEKAITEAQLLASTATLREFIAKLLSAKFDPYLSRAARDALILRLAPLIEIVEIVQSVQASRDPRDVKFLDVALNGRATAIISGDGDLLTLHRFRGIAILTAAQSLARKR
jgi:putative PIN family toxin of toxin-antitoxin system